MPPLVLNRHEAAAALRISIRKLDYLIERGEIAPFRIGSRALFPWTELLRFVESRSSQAGVVAGPQEPTTMQVT